MVGSISVSRSHIIYHHRRRRCRCRRRRMARHSLTSAYKHLAYRLPRSMNAIMNACAVGVRACIAANKLPRTIGIDAIDGKSKNKPAKESMNTQPSPVSRPANRNINECAAAAVLATTHTNHSTPRRVKVAAMDWLKCTICCGHVCLAG